MKYFKSPTSCDILLVLAIDININIIHELINILLISYTIL